MPNTKDEVIHDHQGISPIDLESALIVNINYTGMYNVAYDERNWKRIGSVLMTNVEIIPEATRLQLFRGLQMSVQQKEIKPSMLLCIGEYLVVRSIIHLLQYIYIYIYIYNYRGLK